MSKIEHILIRAIANFIDRAIIFIPILHMLYAMKSIFPSTPLRAGIFGGQFDMTYVAIEVICIDAYVLINYHDSLFILVIALICVITYMGKKYAPKFRFLLIILSNIFSYIFFATVIINDGSSLYIEMLSLLTVTAIVLTLTLMEFICRGSSIGKLLCGLKVVKKDASKLTFTDILERNYLKSLGLLLFPISILYYILKKELPWDYFSQTEIVRRREREIANSPPESPQSTDHNP